MNDALMVLIDNDQFLYNSFITLADLAIEKAERDWRSKEPGWTKEQVEVLLLADDFKEYLSEVLGKISRNRPTQRIISCMAEYAFGTIDWQALARHYLGKVKEIAAYEALSER